jgi:hypothetical protein
MLRVMPTIGVLGGVACVSQQQQALELVKRERRLGLDVDTRRCGQRPGVGLWC